VQRLFGGVSHQKAGRTAVGSGALITCMCCAVLLLARWSGFVVVCADMLCSAQPFIKAAKDSAFLAQWLASNLPKIEAYRADQSKRERESEAKRKAAEKARAAQAPRSAHQKQGTLKVSDRERADENADAAAAGDEDAEGDEEADDDTVGGAGTHRSSTIMNDKSGAHKGTGSDTVYVAKGCMYSESTKSPPTHFVDSRSSGSLTP
jgi:hypothetical protein